VSLKPSPQQLKAIEAPPGPVLVVAGPGAGKTFCLIGRIGHLVTRLGMSAGRICAVTFTNKAAEEIASRLDDTLGEKATLVRRGTIHALCADVLRQHPAEAGLNPGFGIADDDYQRTVLRQMGQGRRAPQLLQLFGRHRLQAYPLTPGDAKLYAEYVRALRRRNVVDFDDLVMLTGELFGAHPEVADAVAGQWDYLLVDEFQDVNAAQYAILRRLAERHGNLFAVGDDEQSIFSWAGADPRVLQRFQQDYDIADPVVLDRNHRSSHQIFTVARRLVQGNPSLFNKELSAPKLSPFAVRAVAHADDDAEADWIIADIEADRASHWADNRKHPLGWGDYAVLYRRHDVGDRLEARFIKSGVPCRLAKGRPLSEDPVIGYVIAAMRLVRDPHDPAAAESFARRVLPPHLLQRVEAEVTDTDTDFLLAVRDVAGSLRGDPDAKKLWRLVYQAENLAAMKTKHVLLRGLVDDLLSQRVGTYRNVLEDHHDDLSDPRDIPAAVALAERLAGAQRTRSRVVLEPMKGLEIALRGLLFGAGFKLIAYDAEVGQAELDDLRVGPSDAGPAGLAFTVFKALQLLHARGLAGALTSYVTFDLETTDLDTSTCEIVEIAAVRVERGVIAGEFHSLVKPQRAVSAGAQATHGFGAADLAVAPSFADVWPRFREFIGASVLVAHNGLNFDVPVLRRMAAPHGGAERLQVFDTLPLARSLSRDSSKLADLAARFGVPLGRAHHALDDARALVGVYEALEARRVVRSRKASLANLLPFVGLALVLDAPRAGGEEVPLLVRLAAPFSLGRFTDCLEVYAAERERLGAHGPALDEVIQRLGGKRLMEKLREERDAAERYPEAIARLEALLQQDAAEPLEDAIVRFLERVALSRSDGSGAEAHRVNLLTLHSTKGLEFSRVYIVGVEDEQLPGWIKPEEDRQHAIEESRRLLYVGMTRASDRLVLTRVDRRAGKPGGASQFLDEMRLDLERP